MELWSYKELRHYLIGSELHLTKHKGALKG